MSDTFVIPLFPLGVTLFPGGVLPLKIFEQRYLDMVKRCIADTSAFGVVTALPADGNATTMAKIGTVAIIQEWDMPHVGIFMLRTVGASRFAIESSWVEEDGLHWGEVRHIADEADRVVPLAFESLARLLSALVENIGQDRFPTPLKLDSASWVSMRLSEVLPISTPLKQQLLEINDCNVRLGALAKFLAHNKITEN